MRKNTGTSLQIIALFCMYIMINISVVHALEISHAPATDVTVTGTSAEIRWTTDADADSSVEYGNDTNLGSSESDSLLKSSHAVTLTGMGTATDYYYKLTSSTAEETATADNGGSLYSFTTGTSTDTAPPQFNVSLPEYYNRRQITFGGYTDPDSVLRLYVNANQADIGTDSYTQFTTSDSSGHFIFRYINLQTENTLVIWARDPAGNTNTETFTLNVDAEEPRVVMSELPALAATTSLAVNGTVSEDVTLTYSVNDEQQTQELTAGSFSFALQLKEGIKNRIDMQFADRAGNVFEKEHAIEVDTKGPTIIWENLAALDPSYIQEIEIEGNVSKPGATIVVFVNNKTYSSQSWSTSVRDMLVHYGSILGEGDQEYVTTADKDGHFKLTVFLTQEISSERSGYQQDPYQTASYYDQTAAGIPAPGPGGAPVSYGTGPGVMPRVTTGATGRYSNAWDNSIVIVAFDELGRSDTRDGIVTFARCGYGSDWNIEIMDPTPSVIIPEHLRQGIAQIAFGVKLKWQGPGDPSNRSNYQLISNPIIQQYKISEQMRQDYVFDPNELVSGVVPVWNPDRTRGYVVIELHKKDYQQKNFSDMEKEDLFLKLPMQIQLEYQYADSSGQMQTAVQKQCWDVVTALDVRIPPSVIPKELLNASIQFFNSTIEAINRILKPLKTITIAVFVTCLLSWVMYFFALMKKAYDCMGEENKKSQACIESQESANKVEKYMHLVCDRIFCPSVPTADMYFQEMASDKCLGQPLDPAMDKNDNGCGQEYMDKWDSGCLLMNELERSKCLRAQAGDARFQEACGESGQLLKNLWYGASDFCRKKDQQQARRISTQRGDKREEYFVDDDGRIYRISSSTTVQAVEKEGKSTITAGSGAAKTSYNIEPLAQYTDENKKKWDSSVTYDNQGRLYYEDSNKARQYLCEGTNGQTRVISQNPQTQEPVWDDRNCKSGALTIPKDVITAANIPGSRTYVVDPTDNLLTALQCVCLPAINGFLTLWRNMLGAVMQCFQSILVTGDGSSGLCRAVLTTYICDVIFSAIRCFVNRFGVGSSSRTKPDMGISRFFKSAATAGGDIRDSITDRYGGTSMFRTMFSEKKLIHAACLWAFTGDFDFDLESALTGPGAIPLNSEAFLYPRTRRFLGSNPITGYTTHIYHIGAGLVAGADIDYKLQLVCSPTDGCDVQEGFANGLCDCHNLNREVVRDITYSFGPGRLVAGEMLGPNEGDIYVKIENEKIRYDKVRLTYLYVDNTGQQVTEVTEGRINQIGGKPPADCKFDVASGEFRCAFEIGDNGYAIFTELPKTEKEFYRLGETANLQFKIDKRSPQPAQASGYGMAQAPGIPLSSYDQRPFYLRYQVFKEGQPIAVQGGTEQVIPITIDGVQESPVRIPQLMITESLLMGGTDTEMYTVPSEVPPGAKSQISPLTKDSTASKVTTHFAAYIREKYKKDAQDKDREFEAVICTGKYKDVEVRGAIKEVFYYDGVSSGKMCSRPETVVVDNRPLQKRVRIEYNGVKMDIIYQQIPVPKKGWGEWGGFIMKYRMPETISTLECSTKYTTARPAVFTVKIGLYPCVRKDENQAYSISNCEIGLTPVNYYSTVQEHDVEIKAVCSASGADTMDMCTVNYRTANECECKDELTGVTNCGKGDKNYCYYAVTDYQCIKYLACQRSTWDKQVKISTSANGIPMPDTDNPDHLYCDCNGDLRMEDCKDMYCYPKGGAWGCYPNPPER